MTQVAESVSAAFATGADYALLVARAVRVLNAAGVMGHLTHVSTAGGAFLESLEGKTLPGVEALLVRETSAATGA